MAAVLECEGVVSFFWLGDNDFILPGFPGNSGVAKVDGVGGVGGGAGIVLLHTAESVFGFGGDVGYVGLNVFKKIIQIGRAHV